MIRTATRGAILVVVTAAALTILVGTADAHAGLEHSDPADGARLSEAPDEITLVFTEPPDPQLSSAIVVDSSGGEIATTAEFPPSDDRTIVIQLPRLGEGAYTATWRVVSTTDGHLTSGTVAFGVGIEPETAEAVDEAPAPNVASVIGRLTLYVGLLGLVGTAVVGVVILGGVVPARRTLLALLGVAALIGAVLMLLGEAVAVGVSPARIVSSSAGASLGWLIVATLIVAIVAAVASRRDTPRTLLLAGAVASAAMFVRAAGGHAATDGQLSPMVLGQWVHMSAVGVWIGGLAIVLMSLRALDEASAPARLRSYSRLAGYAVAIVVLTGIARSVDELGGIGNLADGLRSPYGTTLVTKIAFVVAILGLGAANRFVALRRAPTDIGLAGRLVRFEVSTAIIVLLVTAVLTGLPPQTTPTSEAEATRPTGVVASASDFGTTITLELTVSPGVAGPSAYRAEVTDFDTGLPVDVDAVALTFTPVGRPGIGDEQVDLSDDGGGRWVGAGGQPSVAGAWEVTALVRTGTQAVTMTMWLSTIDPTQEMSVAEAAGQPTIYTARLPDDTSLQVYADPGTPGSNHIHVTAFDPSGSELELSEATLVATSLGGPAEVLDSIRLGPGHFAATTELTGEAWHLDVYATTESGESAVVAFEMTTER